MRDATIQATRTGDGDPLAFDVRVQDADGETRHRVTLARADYERLARGRDAAGVIEASFRFLLDREPKEAILSHFDVSVIARYFPEFERELPSYFAPDR
jgi:hypothetical protein